MSPEAWGSFDHLREAICTASALANPDPQRPLIVEVDASILGVGAVMSQHLREPPELHPCVYLSYKLSLVEQNYDIGNCELLAIKLALEEWRHWLEGAVHSFQVIIGNPSSDRTISLLQNRYWWPKMARDVSQFIRSCSVYATSTPPVIYLILNWFLYYCLAGPGPTLESISSPTCPGPTPTAVSP